MMIPVHLKTLAESNLLLRALWAQLRREYGKLAWQFSPSRHGDRNVIYFGWADLGMKQPMRIGVTYEHRGIANNIVFEDASSNEARLQACVNKALATIDAPEEFSFTAPVQMSLDLHLADATEDIVMLASDRKGCGHIGISRIQAFDDVDARAEFLRRLRLVLDTLSFLTNVQFREMTSDEAHYSPGTRHTVRKPSSAPPTNWIDGYPVVDDLLIVDRAGLKLLNALVSANLTNDLAILADAAHHFHNGLAAEALRFDATTAVEQAVVFYISALEVASLVGAPEPTTCPECGQPQHRIAARVIDFVDRMVGGTAPLLIKGLYGSRSAYLHRGRLLSSRSYLGATLPQLDPSSPTGVLASIPIVPLLNLREFTSYCLRQVSSRLWDHGAGYE